MRQLGQLELWWHQRGLEVGFGFFVGEILVIDQVDSSTLVQFWADKVGLLIRRREIL